MSTVSFSRRVLPDQLHQPSPQLVNPQHSSYETDKQKFDRKFQELQNKYEKSPFDLTIDLDFQELQSMQAYPSENDVRALFNFGCQAGILSDKIPTSRHKSTKQEFIDFFREKGIDLDPPFILVELVQELGKLIPTFNLRSNSSLGRAPITFHRDFVTDDVNTRQYIRHERNEAYKRSLY